jgi:uncharacterized protein (DUF1697 family)
LEHRARAQGARVTRTASKPSTTRCVALLRGINVGRAKRIAMSELRGVVQRLGFAGVRTLLNSGNVVFDAQPAQPTRSAASIAAALQDAFGFPVHVIVITQAELDAVVAGNPLLQRSTDSSRLVVAFAASRAALANARALIAQRWEPDAIALADRAAYLWCARGILQSRLMQAFSRATGETVTVRNWATVLKLRAAMHEAQAA